MERRRGTWPRMTNRAPLPPTAATPVTPGGSGSLLHPTATPSRTDQRRPSRPHSRPATHSSSSHSSQPRSRHIADPSNSRSHSDPHLPSLIVSDIGLRSSAASSPSTNGTANGHGTSIPESGSVTLSTRQFKQLLDQQQKLQETNDRVIHLLVTQQDQSTSTRQKIPKELSVSVHMCVCLALHVLVCACLK